MQPKLLVPGDFAVPDGLRTDLFVIEPLDAHHNESDHAAWTSSIEHIRATPGFAGRTWPDQPCRWPRTPQISRATSGTSPTELASPIPSVSPVQGT